MQKKPHNILIIKNPYISQGFSGGEIHTMQIADYMRSLGDNIYFAGSCPDLLKAAKTKGYITEQTNIGGQEAVALWPLIKFIFYWPIAYFRYKKYLQMMKEKYDIDILYLISWNEKFIMPQIAKKLGIKVFFIEHRMLGNYIYLNPFRWFYAHNSRYAKIIAVSEKLKEELKNLKIQSNNITVIHNGIDTSKVVLHKTNNFTKKPNEFVIGNVARLSPDKGIDYLIEGFSMVCKKLPDKNLTLKIVGDGPIKNDLIDLSKKLNVKDKVLFLGRISSDKIPYFMDSIDIFALTSLWGESFGLVLAEAGLQAKPCIATDIGGMPEVVKNAYSGIIIHSRDPIAIQDAILKFYSDRKLIHIMGENAKKRIKKYFSLDRMLRQFQILFDK